MAGYTGSHNPLLVNYFQFVLDRVPNIVYFCQSVNLPGFSYGIAQQPSIMAYPVNVPTGSINFEQLVLTFRVDENLTNWLELHNWAKTCANYTNDLTTLPYAATETKLGKTSSANLLITNSAYKPKIKVSFRHVFPISVSGINFNATSPVSAEAMAIVKFAHTGYEIERLANA